MKVRWGRVILAILFLAVGCGVVAYLSLISGGLKLGGSGIEVNGPGQDNPPSNSGDQRSTARPSSGSQAGSAQNPPQSGDLKPFRVLSLGYTPYMATLVHMDAGNYLEQLGYDLQLVDVYDENVDLDEAGQCAALKAGDYEALATTLDATRKCGEGVVMAIPVGQSAGNDKIIVKQGVDTWNNVFEHAVAFTDASVSQYMACFASHAANQPIRQAVPFGDAAEAVDAFINSGAEQNIQSVVAWEPEATRALQTVPGSKVLLSSKNVRILWDVIEFSKGRVAADRAPFAAFTKAYYQALQDLTRDPAVAVARIAEWQEREGSAAGLVTTTALEAFRADLDNEAFATLRDAQILMEEQNTVLNRLDEAAFYWQYCGVELPPVSNLASLMDPGFVTELAAADPGLRGQASEMPSGEAFQVSDFTDAAAVTDAQIQAAQVIFEQGVNIEFLANRTDFKDPAAAYEVLQNAVRFLRTCRDCVLQVQGGAAYPGSRICPSCSPTDSDALAVSRGQQVYTELLRRFDVPEAQLRLMAQPHAPQFAGSNDEQQLRQDRRTFLTGLQLGGR